MKHAGAQLFHEQRKLQHSQHGVLVCARNQSEEAWGTTGYDSKMGETKLQLWNENDEI